MPTVTKVRTLTINPPAKAKIKLFKPLPTTADQLAVEYLAIKLVEEQAAERKIALQAAVRAAMTAGELKTKYGSFLIEERVSLSWPLDAVRLALPDQYAAFLTPDNALLRTRAKTADTAGAMLSATAVAKKTEALVFRATKKIA